MARNPAIEGEDSKAGTQPVYCYRIADDEGTVLYLTNYSADIDLANLPAAWTDAADPQTFSRAAINHGNLERKNSFDQEPLNVQVLLEDGSNLTRYVIFGIIPRLTCHVIKVTPGAAASGSGTFDVDSQIVQRGIMTDLEVNGFTLTGSFKPEAFLTQQEVPRWRFTRTCNHELYGPYCGLDRTNFQHGGSVLGIDIDTRQLTVAGDSGLAAGYFRLGYLEHGPTSLKVGIFGSSLAGGNTLVTLHQWLPDISVTDAVTLYAGCDHTREACRQKFNNMPNFGGFPLVPNKNPSIHGAG